MVTALAKFAELQRNKEALKQLDAELQQLYATPIGTYGQREWLIALGSIDARRDAALKHIAELTPKRTGRW